MTSEQLTHWFTYNAPKDDQPARYGQLRGAGRDLAELIDTLCPESSEKCLAITNLRQTIMWANAAIACNE